MLEPQGIRVVTAMSAEEALAFLVREDLLPDVVLLDLVRC